MIIASAFEFHIYLPILPYLNARLLHSRLIVLVSNRQEKAPGIATFRKVQLTAIIAIPAS